MRALVAVVLLLASCVGHALSFSTGAPRGACTTVTPNHPATPQNTPNPYDIDLRVFDDGSGSFTYLPGKTYQLTLSAAGNSTTFRGFFIQGRLVADDSPVGAFVDPPAGGQLSSCVPPNIAITHNSATDKSSITVSWIAPSTGTGAVRFAYAVVQTYLIFWANDTTSTIQEGSNCTVPFYESNGVCVETCPPNEFGNHTSGQCQLYPTGFTASLNATTYVAEITADTPLGTPVLYFSAVIGNPSFTNVFLTLVEDDLVERVFKFPDYPNGATSQTFALTPNAGSNTITIVTQIQYVDDPRNIRAGADPVTLPATYGMNINLAALNPSTTTIEDRSVRAFVTVNPPPDPCRPNPCTNGGTCNAQSTTNYTCTCPPDFTGTNCEVQMDDCVGVDCGNGMCVDGVESFECMCLAGFTGPSCEINIDECETIGCVNGECTDLINAIECDCYPGWTGARCEVDIDYCQPRPFGPCSTTGSLGCNDGNTTYACDCVVGFTGYNCSQDIDECESIPATTGEPACFNDGNCINLLFGRFECSCPFGYSGGRCETDITPCDPNPCENGGTCEQNGLEFTCNCPPGYTGSNCSTDLIFCTPTTCMNGGTCTEGTMILCDCPTGFTGMLCETDPPDCELNTCDNGGTCVEEYGPATSCICTEGFTGARCDIDLPFCDIDTCLNGGTCYEGFGILTTCDCAAGFTGANCSVDLEFCTPDTCLNGGTCIEEAGEQIRCNCVLGFAGMFCDEDDGNHTVCQPATCTNGGTCIEEFGPETSCTCPEGYTGPDCGIDLPFCTPETCLNGGTCHEGPGTLTTCDCAAGFTGTNCSSGLDFCTSSTCLNSGTCVEGYGTETSCMCTTNFTGANCATCIDVPPSFPKFKRGAVTVNESATVTMTCEATGFPAPRIIWLKRNGTEFTDLTFFIQINSSRILITNLVPTIRNSCELFSSSTLTIESVTVKDDGVYVCEVENGLPPIQMNSINISVIDHDECEAGPCQHGGICIELSQNVYCDCTGTGYTGNFCQEQIDPQHNETRPTILKSPDNATKLLFQAVNLTCVADGYPPPVFKWYKDGLLIPNAVQSFFYIDQVTPDLRGYYTCEAINKQDNVTSNPGLVTITNVFQYLTDVEVDMAINDDLINEIVSAVYSVQNENSTVRVYAIQLIHTSNTTAQFLVTVVTNLPIADIQDALTQQLQSGSSALSIGLPITVSNTERYDGCEAIEDYPLNFNFPSISLSWPESNIGVTHSFPCPCLDSPGRGASQPNVTHTCGGNFISKASWQPVDYHQCGFTDITFKLCETQLLLRTSPEQAATDLANITSNTAEINAVDVSVAISIIEDLTTAALTNEEVREGYLETIDNLVQTDTAVIAMSQNNTQSSTRLIDSLTNFTNNLVITNSTSATFTRKTYALQVNDIDTSNFQGQTLSVDLGSVQQAMSSTINIREEAIETIEGIKVFLNRTASVQVPSSVFQDLGQSSEQQRLSYSVFVRDTLFQSSDENQSNLTVGSIIVAVRVNGSTASGNLSTPINVTFQASELIDNASSVLCSLWDPQANGARGVWITDSCDQNHTSFGSTPTPQSPENSMGAEVPTMSTFTAQYSQSGHFGLLLDLNDGPLPPVYGAVLQSFSYVGLVISLVCLTAFLVTHLASRNLRQKEHEQILINLCLALMGMYLVFILGANAAPVPVLCGISAALLQYFMLVFFLWTAVEAFHLYRKLVKVLEARQIPVLKISLVVWLVPILIVVLCAGPGHKFYYLESKSGFCRSRDLPFYIGLIAPFAILYVFNLIMFILIMVSVCKHSYRRRGITTEESTFTFVRKNATIAFSLAILFGLGWGFGLAASGTPSEESTFALQLLFTIFVACQGTLIFVLHGIRKAEARNEWKRWFSTAISKTPDLYSSRKKLDSTATPSNLYVTSPQKQSNTGTLYFDMTLYTNEFEADTSIAAEHTATKKDSDK